VDATTMVQPRADVNVKGLNIFPAGVVDLRRDVYRFVQYVKDKGLVRTKRLNQIPKTAARRLAKILSYVGDTKTTQEEEDERTCWANHVSHVGLELGLISFDTEGVYEGYTSAEPCYPDNEICVNEPAWNAYLEKTPLEKEKAILEAHLKMTPNEFFNAPTLVDGGRFDSWGCATGPASRMNLPKIRQGLLKFLTSLEVDVWYEFCETVERLKAHCPTLILDPSARRPNDESQTRLRDWESERRYNKKKKPADSKPLPILEDIYKDFREFDARRNRWDRGSKRQITSKTPDAFERVEGRYLEFFMREIPYLCGFVDLAYRKSTDRRGLEVSPPFERLSAFRLTSRLFQIMGKDTGFNAVKVTVLPNLEVFVEAPSFPDVILQMLAPYTTPIHEEGPIHRLRLEKKKVVEAAAQDRSAHPPVQLLEGLTGAPLPQSVAVQLVSWFERGDKVVFYEDFGLLEFTGCAEAQKKALSELGTLVEDDRLDGFAIARDPDRAFRRLEERLHVPLRVKHREKAFSSCPGRLKATTKKGRPSPTSRKDPAPQAMQVHLESEDLVGYRTSSASLLTALQDAICGEARTCALVGNDLLVISASALPKLRAVLRHLSERFAVTMEATGSVGPMDRALCADRPVAS